MRPHGTQRPGFLVAAGAQLMAPGAGGDSLAATDATLVLKVLNGDSAAFGELYDRYARLVRSICYDSTRDVEHAQDLAQEVFLRAYAKLNKLKEPDRFGPWLVSIARNVAREYRRSKFRDRHILVGMAPEGEPGTEPREIEDQLSDLRGAIGTLDERERLALHAYYLQGQNVEQVKKVLGVSRSGLYRLLARGRKKLEKLLGEMD